MRVVKFIKTFFHFLGMQNDYLYIGHKVPFNGPHWYKTRFGFNTAWRVAKAIHYG